MTALEIAYTKFLGAVMENKPRPLRALNSPNMLACRACEIDAQILACAEWLKALAEDSAQHMSLGKRLDDIIEGAMTDMAGDVRGEVLKALDDARAA